MLMLRLSRRLYTLRCSFSFFKYWFQANNRVIDKKIPWKYMWGLEYESHPMYFILACMMFSVDSIRMQRWYNQRKEVFFILLSLPVKNECWLFFSISRVSMSIFEKRREQARYSIWKIYEWLQIISIWSWLPQLGFGYRCDLVHPSLHLAWRCCSYVMDSRNGFKGNSWRPI
jgi:hypothetical protein